jgi:hypothetical protein
VTRILEVNRACIEDHIIGIKVQSAVAPQTRSLPVGSSWLALARFVCLGLLGSWNRREDQSQSQQHHISVPQTGLLRLRRFRRKAAMNNATPVRMPCSIQGKACYVVWKNQFIIDERYEPIRALGRGAYGMVMSARDQITGQKVGAHLRAGPCERCQQLQSFSWPVLP